MRNIPCLKKCFQNVFGNSISYKMEMNRILAIKKQGFDQGRDCSWSIITSTYNSNMNYFTPFHKKTRILQYIYVLLNEKRSEQLKAGVYFGTWFKLITEDVNIQVNLWLIIVDFIFKLEILTFYSNQFIFHFQIRLFDKILTLGI